jgi:hypothetical protein
MGPGNLSRVELRPVEAGSLIRLGNLILRKQERESDVGLALKMTSPVYWPVFTTSARVAGLAEANETSAALSERLVG